MNKYNFENKKKKSQKSIIFFVLILIIAIFAYINNDKVLVKINDSIKNATNMIDTINGNASTKEKLEEVLIKDVKTIELANDTNKVEKKLIISKKKQDFLNLLLAPINKVYNEFDTLYKDIRENPNDKRIKSLIKEYKVKTYKELLLALKPHPQSIALAQAAMESAWATSRFFKEANNIFGVWSFNKNEARIAASSLRGKQTIWLKKYESVEASVRDYYKTLSKGKAFKAFRALNYEKEHQNPYLLTKKLNKYSEKGEEYGKELNAMILYNKFTRFDEKNYEKDKLVK